MLKFITNIKVAFYPFKPSSTSVRIFLNQVSSGVNIQSNPQCKIDVITLSDKNATPTAHVQFKDGKKLDFKGHELSGDDMVRSVQKYVRKLSQEEDLKG
ncbi:hypothetical protein H4219_000452 [Mycoemilia scoparia]|uniref:Large ribosomal subunit protein mL53 n=1 Tax=Mycoemilia scoparia TaxID=417184 RepID=A0A9W8DWL9_9FUNG|nr:hypothetical protein H4219_000452 [Mycoemilia scoparia]